MNCWFEPKQFKNLHQYRQINSVCVHEATIIYHNRRMIELLVISIFVSLLNFAPLKVHASNNRCRTDTK